jgi:hypothetical protein
MCIGIDISGFLQHDTCREEEEEESALNGNNNLVVDR